MKTLNERDHYAPLFEPDLHPNISASSEVFVYPSGLRSRKHVEWLVCWQSDGGGHVELSTFDRAEAIEHAAREAVRYGVPLRVDGNVRFKGADIIPLRPKPPNDWRGEW